MMIPSTDLSTWAASLIVDFPQENIPLLYNSEDWKSWGNLLIQEATFAENGAPNTVSFKDWQPWAQAVFHAMANY